MSGALRIVPSLSYNVDPRCNMGCEYCPPYYENYQSATATLDDETAAAVFLGAADAGIVTFRLSGGEPLLRPAHVVHIAQALNSHPRAEQIEVRLNTNGSRLLPHLQRLREAGVDVLKISVDTLDPEKFKRLTGYGRLDRILFGVLEAQAAGMSVELNMVYMRSTADEVWPLVDFCVDNGLEGLKILDLVEYDDPAYFREHYLAPVALLEELEAAFGSPRVNRLSGSRGVKMLEFRASDATRVLVKDCRQGTTYSNSFCDGCSLYPCQEGFYNLTLNSDGVLKPCRLMTGRHVDLLGLMSGRAPAEARSSVAAVVADQLRSHYDEVRFEVAWGPSDAAAH